MIIGFYFKKILIERKEPLKGEVKINTKTNIKNIEKRELKAGENPALKFDFEFSVNYEPKFSEIKIEGYAMYLADQKETKEILDSWKKKEIPEKAKLEILNMVLSRCNIKSLILEEDLGLPPHLPMPKFQGKKEENKASSTGSYTG